MADIAENKPEAEIVTKEVEENNIPKVPDTDDVKLAENGYEKEVPAKNGDAETVTDEVAEEEDESKDGEEDKNGDATDAPTTEAVKRKVESDSVDGAEESAETPEKKSKLSEDNIAAVEAEATA